MKEYKLTDLVSNGSNARKEVNPTVVVSEGEYKKGTILDANSILEYIEDASGSNKGEILEFKTTGNGNAITSITKDQQTVNIVKDTIFLTEHQKLDNYYTKAQVDSNISAAKSELIGGAPQTYDTFKEIADYIEKHKEVETALNAAISNKADKDSISDMATLSFVEHKLQSAKTEADNTYAKQEGYYPDLIAGTAANLEGKNDIINASMYRPTGGNYDVDNGAVSINSIQGNAVAWNQLVKSTMDGSVPYTSSNSEIIYNKDSVTTNYIDGKSGTRVADNSVSLTDNHVYFATAYVKSTSPGKISIGVNNLSGYPRPKGYSIVKEATTTYNKISLVTPKFTYDDNYPRNLSIGTQEMDVIESFTFKNFLIFDLTLIYGAGNEPTTPEQFEADYQRWFGRQLEYEEYDEGSIRTVLATGIKTVGFNLYSGGDFEGTMLKWYNGGTILWKNDCGYKGAIHIQFDVKYTRVDDIENTREQIMLRIIHDDDTVERISIGRADAYVNFTTTDSVKYIQTIYAYASGDIVKITNLCINFSWSGKRDGEYEPYWEETKALPITSLTSGGEVIFPDGLKRAGSVYDEIFVENGVTKAVKRVGSVDLGDFSLSYNSNVERFRLTYIENCGNNYKDNNYLCAKYNANANVYTDANRENGICVDGNSKQVLIRDSSYTDAATLKSSLVGVILYYELAEPITYTIDNFNLPVVYKIDDFGTEQILSPANGIAPVLVTRYGINAVDTLRRLHQNYISVQSMDEFLTQLGSVISGKFNRTWDEQKGCYTFSFIDELEPESLETEE